MAILQHKPNDINEAVRKLTPMVYKMAHKYARNHKAKDFDDLVQDGFEGLMKAYHKYDPNKGTAFSSYAYQWIFAHISDHAGKNWNRYNNTASKSYEDYDLGTYTHESLNDVIDFKNKLSKMDPTTRAIIKAKSQGFTYKQIAEGLTTIGKPTTLHQVYNAYKNSGIEAA